MKKLQSFLYLILMSAVIATFAQLPIVPVLAVLFSGYLILNTGFKQVGILGDFITILDSDPAEIKQGKENLNKAFKSLDEKSQNALGDFRKSFDKEAETLRGESKALKDELVKLTEAAQADKKGLSDKLEEVEKSLTEMSRAKAKQDSERTKTMRDNINEQFEGKEADIKKYLQNKSSGLSMEFKAVTSMGVIANSVAADYQPNQAIPHNLTHARDYIPVSPTNSNLIRYIRFTTKEGAFGVVAAGTSKPKRDYNQTVVDAAVIKLAGLVDVHDEFLEDVEGSRAWLSDELIKSLYDVEDAQVFKGSGAGNMAGLYTNASAMVFPYARVLAASENNIEKIAAAITYVSRLMRNATAAFTSPEDLLAMYLNKGTTNEYTYPLQFNGNGEITILGKPVIGHNVFLPGEALTGDFNQGARIFQKTGMTLAFSTENKDNFETNVTTARVEMREALANFLPDSFIKVGLNGAVS